jgi:hypothetical protein
LLIERVQPDITRGIASGTCLGTIAGTDHAWAGQRLVHRQGRLRLLCLRAVGYQVSQETLLFRSGVGSAWNLVF